MELFIKFKDFINREIKEENEPKETAVLIRVLCILDFIIQLIEYPYIAGKYGFPMVAVCLIPVSCSVIIFGLSYKIKMKQLIYCYYFAVSILAVSFTLAFGIRPMFHMQLAIVFLLFFYRSSESSQIRILSVIFTCCLYIFSYVRVMKVGSFYSFYEAKLVAIPISNIIWASCKVAIIGVFFRLKFSASEEKILKYSKKLELVATTDPLTKLQNRRGMLNHIEKFIASSTDKILSVAIGDIDFFKKINDTYGHEAGDYILETLAKLMNDFMDGKGMVARWGGEEFLFAFEDLNGDLAFEHLSKLLSLIEKYEFEFGGVEIKLTMTFGVEEHDTTVDIDKTIQAADEKLYMGKTSGRDRVVY